MNDFTEHELDLIKRQREAMVALYNRIQEGGVVFVAGDAAEVLDEFNQALLDLQEADNKGVPSINDYIAIHNAALAASAEATLLFEDEGNIKL